MKKAIFLLFLALPVWAQDARVTFPQRVMTLERSLSEIERQTDFLVSVSHGGLDLRRRVRLSNTELNVGEALKQLLTRGKHTFSVHGNHIVIFSKRAGQPLPPAAVAGTEAAEAEACAEPKPYRNLHLPPVDTDSLEVALHMRRGERGDNIPAAPHLDPRSLPAAAPAVCHPPAAALRTNLLWAAAGGTPNIGVEVGLAPRVSLVVEGGHNPWRLNASPTQRTLCHSLVAVEGRWWFCERFTGHFLGAHAFGVDFHVRDKFRYKGRAAGAGLSWGWHLPLTRHWSVEFNLGAGVGMARFDKFDCDRCSDPLEPTRRKTFFAPTRAGVNLVFAF